MHVLLMWCAVQRFREGARVSFAERTREKPIEGKKGGRHGAEADRSKQRAKSVATGDDKATAAATETGVCRH